MKTLPLTIDDREGDMPNHNRVPSHKRIIGFAVACTVVCILLLTSVSAQDQALRAQLLQQVASAQHVSVDRLKIGDIVSRDFSLTGSQVYEAKIVDKLTGDVYLATVDKAGKSVDVAAAASREANAKAAKFGKIDPRLHALMQNVEAGTTATAGTAASKGGKIPVTLWLRTPEVSLFRSTSVPDAATARINQQIHLNDMQREMTPVRERVIKALSKMAEQAVGATYSPVVFANLTPGQIRAIANHSDVAVIYGPEQYGRTADDSSTTQRAYRVWAAGNLGQGGSARPVVHEDDGIADFNPFLSNATHPVLFYCSFPSSNCSVGKNIGSHASEVAGVIASTHSLFRGMAPSTPMLLSANFQSFNNPGFDQRAIESYEWAVGNGGGPVNMSWGTICGGFKTAQSQFIDFATANLFSTSVISAGNTGFSVTCGGTVNDEKVSAPGLAWTAITVGSQFDNNDGFWAGDGMSAFSRWRNPDFATGMEKPEVVAVGQDVRTTDNSTDDFLTPGGVNGTSFSAPQVAGQVATLLSRKPGQNQWPETNKAAVLVSAYHDVDTALGTSKDGVGSVVMNNSDDTYRVNRFVNDCSAGCGRLQVADFPRNYAVNLSSGQRVRAAIAWDAMTTGTNGSTSDELGADIDLHILRPDGTFLAFSTSVQNAWEMAEFTAPVTGTYTFRAHHFSSVAGWPGTFLGMAYSVRSLPDFCTGVTSGVGIININTANGPTWFDSYAGWGFNQSGREYIRKLVLTTTMDINVSDTNNNVDLHVIQNPGCTTNPIVPTVLANGFNSAFVDNAPPGTYFVIADGFNGFVGTDSLTISLTGP